jgi:hypothetical protein
MPVPVNKIEIDYKGESIKVQIIDVVGQRIYKVNFPAAAPIFLTRAKNAEEKYFWTSVPEGKQKLAEEIGALIEPYLKAQ